MERQQAQHAAAAAAAAAVAAAAAGQLPPGAPAPRGPFDASAPFPAPGGGAPAGGSSLARSSSGITLGADGLRLSGGALLTAGSLPRLPSGDVFEGFPCVRIGDVLLPSSMDLRAFLGACTGGAGGAGSWRWKWGVWLVCRCRHLWTCVPSWVGGWGGVEW